MRFAQLLVMPVWWDACMRTVQVTRLDGPSALETAEVPEPVATDNQVLIDVHSAGVTFPDLLMTRGEYQLKPPLPFTPGCEVAGMVVSAPADSDLKTGDRVAAFTMLNGYGEQVVVDPDFVFALPDDFSFDEGAALPMNYLTVEFALFTRGRLQADETVLVHGAAGGVGTAAIQVAKAAGARVIAVVSTREKGAVAAEAGADEWVLVDGFAQAVKDLTGGRGVDIVVDPVGGDRFTDSLRSLAPEGRLLVIGFTAGEIPSVKVNRLLLNNIDVVGVAWGSFAFTRPGYLGGQWPKIRELIATGRIRPPIGDIYPLAQTGAAIGELSERVATGKVIVRVKEAS